MLCLEKLFKNKDKGKHLNKRELMDCRFHEPSLKKYWKTHSSQPKTDKQL